MPESIKKPVLLLLVLSLICVGSLPAQDIIIGNIEFDRIEWGSRLVYIPVENAVDDIARLNIIIHTIYPGHYLSGLERLEVDTTVMLAPEVSVDLAIPFVIHGSFERVVTRVMIFWNFDSYVPEANVPDSTFQIFNRVYNPKGDADEYLGRKHAIGPVYSVMDHFLMNFEYPRLVLFLMSRGMSAENISSLFKAEHSYTGDIINDLRQEGFFPLPEDSLVPGLLAISESEGYTLKNLVQSAADAFSSWYEETGRKEIENILDEVGIDDYNRGLPALQLPLLHTLLMEEWVEKTPGFDVLGFNDKDYDLQIHNQPRWIVQGGEYFLPKLCLAAFEERGELHFGTFSPDPSLPFDKATIYNLRKQVEQEAGSVVTIDAVRIQKALAKAREIKLVDEIGGGKIRQVIENPETQAILKTYKPFQEPYLADYIIRSALGEYFLNHRPDGGLDCIKVGY
jgi:hypothetical protein